MSGVVVCQDEAVDAATLEYLASPPGRVLLDAVRVARGSAGPLAVSARLRSAYEPSHIAAALTQVELRKTAGEKFGTDAESMFFTRDGLQQATHRLVAAHRAERAVTTGTQQVLELGCGIGADLIAFCKAGLTVRAVDADPLTATLAETNLRVLGLDGAVAPGRAENQDLSGMDLVYVDPARRGLRGRVFDPAAYSPPWSFVESLLVGDVGPDAVVKAAPGLAHERVPAGIEAEWVSLDGRLREAALWSGRAVTARRRATLLRSTGASSTLTDADDPGRGDVSAVGRFVYEPDDAVIRAHLVTAAASLLDGWLLDEHLAYLSSDELHQGPYARAFEVLDVLPFKEKALREALRARDIGSVTIKKRGVTVTPEVLRNRLHLSGGTAGTIIVSRTPTGTVALLVRPVPR